MANNNTFTREDLQSGDILILRNSEMGVVLVDIGQVYFQNVGMCYLDEFTEDLRFVSDFEGIDPDFDVMEVRRPGPAGPISFLIPAIGEIVYHREEAVSAKEPAYTEASVYD